MSEYLLKRRAEMMGLKEPDPKKSKTPIPKKSAKRKEVDKEYLKLVKAMLKENPLCEIRVEGCTGKAQGLHHLSKRSPKNICDPNNLKRACNHCNLWIELHPLEAIKLGHSKSKHLRA